MSKTPVQFRHNGVDVAVFVDGGANLLTAIREGVGDTAPKFGCGQGTCGVCTVLIDGEPHLSCITLAESVAGRSVETADGLKNGPDLHPLQRAFMEHFAAQCGFCTPGHADGREGAPRQNPSPTPDGGGRGDRRQHLPLHRLRADHQRRPGGGRRRPGRAAARLRKRTMLEFRKEYFADERDDNLNEIGKPTQRQDMLGHVTGTTTYFDDHKVAGLLHLKVLRSPHHHARIRRIDTAAAERAPGVRRVIRGADVPVNLNTLLSLLNFGKDDEPSLAVDKVRYKGEPIVAVVANTRARGVRGAGAGPGRLRAAAGRLRRRGGAEARRAGRQRDLSEEHLRVPRPLRPPEAPLRRRRARLRRGRPRARGPLPDVADRARADGDQRLRRRAREQRPLRGLHLRAGAVLLARHLRQDPRRALEPAALRRRHRRRRLRRQGRQPDRAARDPRRDAHGPPGALRARARGGDAVRLAARRRAHLRQGRRACATGGSPRAR